MITSNQASRIAKLARQLVEAEVNFSWKDSRPAKEKKIVKKDLVRAQYELAQYLDSVTEKDNSGD